MNTRRLIPALTTLLMLLVPFAPTQAQSPPRGAELRAALQKGGLVRGGRAPRVTWLPDGSAYLVEESSRTSRARTFMKVDPETGAKSPFFDADRMRKAHAELTGDENKGEGLPFRRFTFAPGGTRICFGTDRDGVVICDLDKDYALQRFPKIVGSHGPRPKRSPDWTRVAYVKDYDLYVTSVETGKEQRLTTGGSEEIRNGHPDWVYPEEFSQREAFWWSPDGAQIAFLRFDESPVAEYPLVGQAEPRGKLRLQRYPKAGDANPIVTLHVVDVATKQVVDVETGPENDIYLVRVKWLPDGSAVTFQRLNRLQNVLELLAADPQTGATRLLLREEEECFVNVTRDLRFLKDGQRYLWTSERSGWRHIYLYHIESGLIRQLTRKDLPVKSILAVDEDEGLVYFNGFENKGLDGHLYRVGFDGGGFQRLTADGGTHQVNLAPGGTWFLDTWSSVDTPPEAGLFRGDGKEVRMLSEADTTGLDALKLEPAELLTFKAADGKTDLHGVLFKPAGYDPSEEYPLMVHVYGGPHSQSVLNRWLGNHRFQTEAQLGYMVFEMNNRGTVSRGKAFESATYLKLGQVDLADQVAGVKHVTKRSYIDGSRVGITGGSYGGYMVCMALLAAPDVFHVGVASSSVTDWRNYDTIYTERYMRRPQDNPQGYEKGSALTYADDLKGKLLLFHGTIDDNVHPSNTVQLVNKLIEHDKRFDMVFYPEYGHGIWGAGGRHLRSLSREYFADHLQP